MKYFLFREIHVFDSTYYCVVGVVAISRKEDRIWYKNTRNKRITGLGKAVKKIASRYQLVGSEYMVIAVVDTAMEMERYNWSIDSK